MKKIALVFLLSPFLCFSQIGVTKTKKTDVLIEKYDSTYNFPAEKIDLLIGQELFVPPKNKDLRKYGYDVFLTDSLDAKYPNDNIYAKIKNGYSTQHDSVANRVFILKKIINPKAFRPLLLLEDKENKQILFWKYKMSFESAFPFLVNGYLKKIENNYIGKKFVIREFSNPVKYINEGPEVEFGKTDLWEVKQLTLDYEYYSLAFILEKNGQQILSFLEDFKKNSFEEKEFAEIKKKYPKYYENILNKTVVVGMPEKAVVLSWGLPKKINKSSSSNQWVYDGNYLYFENGIMTAYN